MRKTCVGWEGGKAAHLDARGRSSTIRPVAVAARRGPWRGLAWRGIKFPSLGLLGVHFLPFLHIGGAVRWHVSQHVAGTRRGPAQRNAAAWPRPTQLLGGSRAIRAMRPPKEVAVVHLVSFAQKLAGAEHYGTAATRDSPTAARGAVPQIHVPCGPRRRSGPGDAQMGCTAPVTRPWPAKGSCQLQPHLRSEWANHDCGAANQPPRRDPNRANRCFVDLTV